MAKKQIVTRDIPLVDGVHTVKMPPGQILLVHADWEWGEVELHILCDAEEADSEQTFILVSNYRDVDACLGQHVGSCREPGRIGQTFHLFLHGGV